jgi:hypothetical protein
MYSHVYNTQFNVTTQKNKSPHLAQSEYRIHLLQWDSRPALCHQLCDVLQDMNDVRCRQGDSKGYA